MATPAMPEISSSGRLWLRSALAVLTFILIAAACNSTTEFGTATTAAATAETGTEATVHTPPATPVVPTPVIVPDGDATSGGSASDGTSASDDGRGDQEYADGALIEVPGVNYDEPVTRLVSVLPTLGNVGDVAYGAPLSEDTVAVLDDSMPLRGFTPDGLSRWVQVPSGIESCPEATLGTRLGLADVETDAPRAVDPQNDSLLDITRIHHGPDNYVMLESSCGKYTSLGPVALLAPDGSLTHMPVADDLAGSLFSWEPRWGRTEAGELVVVAPLGGNRRTAIDNYMLVETGEVIEKVATDVIGRVQLALAHEVNLVARVEGVEGGFQLRLNGNPVWNGVMYDMAHDSHNFITGGPDGGVWIQATRPWDEPRVTSIDRAIGSVAISPNREVLAVSGPDGTELIGARFNTRLADVGGVDLVFSSDGTQLQMTTADDSSPTGRVVHRWTFGTAAPEPGAIRPGTVVSSAGLGPIRVGMTIGEIETATGRSFAVNSIGDFVADECFSAYADDLPGVSLIGLAQSSDPKDAVVNAVTVTSGLYPTPSGVRVGDSADKVRKLFPNQIESSPHTYSNGIYLDYLPVDEGELNSVRFETMPGGQVHVIHGGVIGWTRLVEGCA